ncbi:MAG: hypothetical protein CFE29_01790 [Bradyrhizobiaceae bacterium PARB1]|nr:MAG: hypothetical protein CFE29_01790 [Bradyrhizobiaceae bacterium PARB1]
MSRRVILSDNAQTYLRAEARYLRDRSPSAAEKLKARFRKARQDLSQFPELGRKKDGLPLEGAMRLVVGDYIVDYELHGEIVEITSVRHGRQLDPDFAQDDDFDYETEIPSPLRTFKS